MTRSDLYVQFGLNVFVFGHGRNDIVDGGNTPI